jgi:hypothetical protein
VPELAPQAADFLDVVPAVEEDREPTDAGKRLVGAIERYAPRFALRARGGAGTEDGGVIGFGGITQGLLAAVAKTSAEPDPLPPFADADGVWLKRNSRRLHQAHSRVGLAILTLEFLRLSEGRFGCQ